MPAGHGARSAGALGSRLQLVLDEVVMMALERVWQGAGPSPTRQSPCPHGGAAAGFRPGRCQLPGCVQFSLYRGERRRRV